MIKVVLLGAGNVASHLYGVLQKNKEIAVIQCYNRQRLLLSKEQSLEMVTDDIQKLKVADIYILALSDDAIAEVSAKLPFKNRLVVHTSGSVPMDTIDDKHQKGVFYPLQTFSKEKDVDFRSVPFCLEAQNYENLNLMNKIASSLSEKVYNVSSQQRSILHVAAVFVNNFTNFMYTTGKDICEEHEVPFEILHSLIAETAKKATELDPGQAQTGPAVRNDVKTINRHLNFITDNTHKEIYKTLTKAIQSKYGKEL